MGERGDDQHGRDREQDEPAAVEEGRELVGAPDQQRDHDQADDPEAVEDPARAGG